MSDFSSSHPSRLRRSVLCLPASNSRAIAKLSSLDHDCVILDLEDAVAEESKAEARDNIRAYLADRPQNDREIIIRINDKASAHFGPDLDLILQCQPDAVLLPKVETRDDIMDVSAYLAENDAPESVRIWSMIETPLAVINAGAIAEAGRTRGGRLDCLVVGLNDLRKATGVRPDPARTYLVPWLMQVLLAARAFGLSAIDAVSNDFRDLTPFEAECRQGRAMGYDGKMLIHPAQIGPANSLFAPSGDEIANAQRIVEAFSAPEARERNVIDLDGQMVERLHFDQARRLLALVEDINQRTRTP